MAEGRPEISRAPNTAATRALAIAAAVAALFYFVVRLSVVATGNAQWDFRTYYAAAKVYSQGGNPYHPVDLAHAVGEAIKLPYLYPPYAVHLFRPFALLDYHDAYVAFFALKIAALALLICLWWKLFVRDERHAPLFLMLCAFAYNETILRDLVAGNVSTFEQLLIWSAVASYLSGRVPRFCLLIGLSALFKGVSLLFLLLPLIGEDRRTAVRPMMITLASFLGLHLISFLCQPLLYRDFLSQVASLDERGIVNPASLALARDCVAILFRQTGWTLPGLVGILYGAWVALLAVATGTVVKRSGWCLGREKILFVFLFIYALILPRFKDYSYMLVIIPSWYAVQVVFQSLWAKLVAAAALCIGSAPLAGVAKALLGVGVIHGSVLLDRILPAAVEFVVSYKSLLILAALFLLCLYRWSRAVAWRFGGSPPWIAANVLDPWELKGAGRGW